MKTDLINSKGEKTKQIDVPEFFSVNVREDLIQKIIETKKTTQPYGPNPLAGNQYSASGKLKHHRHVWKSQYGRGMSRVPRKQRSRRGSQFDWVGATVPNTRGGRRAHPPKVVSMFEAGKVNKKELRLAIMSALSATASKDWVVKRYSRLEEKDLKSLPMVVESKFVESKSKELLQGLKKLLGEKVFEVAVQKKSIRKGIGKLRGRKYKKTQGLLVVVGKDEKFKTTAFDVQSVKTLGLQDLAKGVPGRLTIYTEKAFQELKEKFSGKTKSKEDKK